jgi:hypothetical protein
MGMLVYAPGVGIPKSLQLCQINRDGKGRDWQTARTVQLLQSRATADPHALSPVLLRFFQTDTRRPGLIRRPACECEINMHT